MTAQRRRTGRSLSFISTLLLSSAIAAPAFAQIEEVIVTAQKRTEDIQTVPIAITAFTAKDLAAHQIAAFKDLQFSTPNVSFTQGNFGVADFQIRGIGVTAVGYDQESGVAVHQNDVFLSAPPLAEATFFDLEQIAVLRGPQSTLYGRGATGGAVNIITAKPILDSFGADGEVSYGNYNAKELKGMVNVPIIEDVLGVRLAGDWVKRDGFVTNIADSSKIDSRNVYSLRGSVRWQPSDRTTVDFVAETGHENDSRMRAQKQLCTFDPSGVMGCLPDSLGTGIINNNSTLATIASSKQALSQVGFSIGGAPGAAAFGAMGLFDLTQPTYLPAPLSVLNPTDLRKVNTDFTPVQTGNGWNASLTVKQNLADWLDATFVGGFQKGKSFSQESYNNVGGIPFSTPSNPFNEQIATGTFLGTLAAFFGPGYAAHYLPYFSVPGSLPVSGIGGLGLTGGNIKSFSNTVTAYDQSDGDSKEYSAELRFSTKFNGPVNFLLAGYYLKTTTHGNYWVAANTFDYPFVILGAFVGRIDEAFGVVPPGYCTNTGCINPGYYHNEGTLNTLESKAIFGEVYYDAMPDTLKFTLGARFTQDDKFQQGRIFIFPGPVPIGTTDENAAAATLVGLGLADFDASVPGGTLYQFNKVEFNKLTGRAVADWTPKLDFTDATLVYASYARGYKAGGFNPGIQPGLGIPAGYGPESIDALELGTKNTLMDATLQFNGDIWYYDYKGLQVSAIVQNTSVNQNIDAKLYGVEGELIWQPTQQWAFNLNLGTTHSAIGNVALIDQRNPTAGRTDVVLVKGASLGATVGQNCILFMLPGGGFGNPTGTTTPGDNPAYQGTPGLAGTYFSPPGGSAALSSHGVAHVNYGLCGKEVSEATMNLFGYSYVDPTGVGHTDGSPVSLSGNQLQNTPSLTVSMGAQYTMPIADYHLVSRVDYYWQDKMFGRIFNGPADRIKSWDVMNAQITLNSPDDMWYLRGFVKNVFNKDNITGMYLTSSTSGLYTNVFLGDPRTFGAALGVHF